MHIRLKLSRLLRLVNRANRLKAFIDINAPETFINNEIALIQDAVDNLFDNTSDTKETFCSVQEFVRFYLPEHYLNDRDWDKGTLREQETLAELTEAIEYFKPACDLTPNSKPENTALAILEFVRRSPATLRKWQRFQKEDTEIQQIVKTLDNTSGDTEDK